MAKPTKKLFNTNDLPDHIYQNLIKSTEKLEDKILSFLDGTDTNVAIFSLVSATARIVGSTFGNLEVADETDLKNLSEDFDRAILATFRDVRENLKQ